MSESIINGSIADLTITQVSPPTHAISSPDSGNDHLTRLSPDSQAYAFIEYFLRLSLHASTAQIVSAYEVSNPQLTLQFEKRSNGVLTIDSWVDLSNSPDSSSEEDIISHGFQQSGNSALRFSVGRVKLRPEDAPDSAITKKFLLCKVAVGRAYNSTEDFAKIATIPDGYDSFVLDRQPRRQEDEGSCQVPCSGDEVNEYMVKDAAQVLPTYVVTVEFDPVAERRSRQMVSCENCESATATVFCQADAANLCASCDTAMHSSKLAARHHRIPLDQGPQAFACCRAHPDKLVEFFCPACSVPVCVHCKMVGHHSGGEAARHKLITVAEAYRSVAEASRASDPVLEARRSAIQRQVESVNQCARAVESNAAQIQQALEDIYRKAQADLKTITKKKLNVLKGDVVELQRQLAEIGRLENFLAYQQEGGNPTQFILDWGHHQKLRAELHSFPYFRQAIDVQPDIRINGAIQVHVDSAGMPLPPQTLHPDDGPSIATPSLKASTLFDANSKKYPQARARPLPTFDLGVYAKAPRKGSDYVLPSESPIKH